jgi:flagellar M-ring protein FliF
VIYGIGILLGYLLILRPLMRLVTTRFTPDSTELARNAADRRAAEAAAVAAARDAKDANGNAVAALPGTPAVPALGADGLPVLPGATGAAGAATMVPLLENYDLPPPGSAVDVMVDHLKVLAAKEPERVAEVVKQWMQKNGRTQ